MQVKMDVQYLQLFTLKTHIQKYYKVILFYSNNAKSFEKLSKRFYIQDIAEKREV